MKINEITTKAAESLTEQELFEAVDMENDTGLRTEDVVKLIRTSQMPAVRRHTPEEALRKLEEDMRAHGITA